MLTNKYVLNKHFLVVFERTIQSLALTKSKLPQMATKLQCFDQNSFFVIIFIIFVVLHGNKHKYVTNCRHKKLIKQLVYKQHITTNKTRVCVCVSVFERISIYVSLESFSGN